MVGSGCDGQKSRGCSGSRTWGQINFAGNKRGKLANQQACCHLCALYDNTLERGVQEQKRGEKKRLGVFLSLLPSDWGYKFSPHQAWQLLVCLQPPRKDLAVEGMGDCSPLPYLQYASIAGIRAREENRSRLLCQFYMEAEELWKG